jgi:PhnB protein
MTSIRSIHNGIYLVDTKSNVSQFRFSGWMVLNPAHEKRPERSRPPRKCTAWVLAGYSANRIGANMFRFTERNAMAKKIDPLNKNRYGAVSAMLTVSDIKASAAFYQKAFGFTKRGIMNGPDGKPIHAELTLRGTTLMLGPENPARGMRSAKTLGASPASLFLYVEKVDKVVAKAVGLGATAQGQVMDMFWGDRCGTLVDPDGYTWMVSTHKAEPTSQEMKKKMAEQMGQQPAAATTVAA